MMLLALCTALAATSVSAQTMEQAIKQSTAGSTAVAGQDATLNGASIKRDGEQFVMRLLDRTDHVVLLTDETTIKSERKGLFRGAHPYDVTSLIDGLICEVDGKFDEQGRIVAGRIRFTEADLHAAITTAIHSRPIEATATAAEESATLANASATLANASATLANASATLANERISNLDQWEKKGVVSLYFAVSASDLSAKSMATLDELAAKAPGAKNYKVEITGHTDATGNDQINDELSEKRAEAVVKYLTVDKQIPLSRVALPMGYGATAGSNDNATEGGRGKNRRVDVRVLLNVGASQTEPTPAG